MKVLSLRPNLSAWKIAGIYAIAGYLWILFSDQILQSLVNDTETLTSLQTYKGWFYVGMTALLVQMLVKRRLVAIKQVQSVLQEREVRFRGLFDHSPVPLIEADFSEARQKILHLHRNGVTDLRTHLRDNPELSRKISSSIVVREVNQAAARLFCAESRDQILGMIGNVRSDGLYQLAHDIICHFDIETTALQQEASMQTIRGEKMSLLVSAILAPGSETSWDKVLISLDDLTAHRKAEAERIRLEAQLRQAQKMESIGALAGGIAHDFNNILTPLCGYADLALEDLPASSPIRDDIEQMQKAAYRGKDLVKQILGFSRRSDQQKIVVDLRLIVKETAKLIRASLPPSIDIKVDIDRSVGRVQADPTQIHQVLMNLCTNAFHAMKDTGGVLTLSLEQVRVDDSSGAHLSPGEYVACAVTDTGCGIAPENQERIFEPFFTTKEAGEGTGLGLSVSHGIVVSHGGTITCTSQQFVGTTFLVYLPVSTVDTEQVAVLNEQQLRGCESILVVDDDPIVGKVAQEMLMRQGYKVRYLASAVDALELLSTPDCPFDLALLNQAMPKISGLQLAERVRKHHPDLPIAMVTGFGKGLEQPSLERAGIHVVIAKPFSMIELARGVRTALSGQPAPVAIRLP